MNVTVKILQDVVVSSENNPESNTEDSFTAVMQALAQPMMQLTSQRPIEPGAAVRIDADDAIWLGEVEQCSPGGDGFSVRVRLRHVLRDFDTLSRLAERFGTVAPKRTPVTI